MLHIKKIMTNKCTICSAKLYKPSKSISISISKYHTYHTYNTAIFDLYDTLLYPSNNIPFDKQAY